MVEMRVVYFPEPASTDDTWGESGAPPVEWLRRSTLPRAVSLRAALNENLNHFQPNHAASLAKKLRADWKSHYFELLVGRWLQELGADPVEHEPVGSNGTKIDYCGSFRDGAVCVEAYSKRMNLHAVEGIAYVNNSEQRIRQAFRDPHKRAQAAGANAPPILAIDGGIFGAHDYDFDSALLGSTVQYMGLDRDVAGHGFNATTGDMATDAASPWAGVLAFLEPGVFGAREPILYASPHFRGHLPLALVGVQRRMLGVVEFPGNDDRPMDRIPFGEPLTDGP